jgi:hypothetical protein
VSGIFNVDTGKARSFRCRCPAGEKAFTARLAELSDRESEQEALRPSSTSTPKSALDRKRQRQKSIRTSVAENIDKSQLSHPEPRRLRDREHVRFVAKQPCLICGRVPSDPHHLRFVQRQALGRKVSDEYTVPLCRGHHRELHHRGDETAWWQTAGIDPTASARALWLQTHPLPASSATRGQ